MGNRKLFGVIIVVSIFCIQISTAHSTYIGWIIYDSIDDVSLIEEGSTPPYIQGDFHDEIDIISLKMKDEILNLTFQGIPKPDFNCSYSVYVFWNDAELKMNIWTFAKLDSTTNYVEKCHLDESYLSVIDAHENDTITITETSLLIPVIDYSSLEDPFSPYITSSVICVYRANSSLSYKDRLDSTANPISSTKNGNLPSVYSSIVFTVIGIIYLRKRRGKK